MARRKVIYRKENQNKISMFLVSVVVLMVVIVVAVGGTELRKKNAEQDEKIDALEIQIEAEKQRTEEIEGFGKYTQTKKFVEEVAKDKLGYVYEGEIVFQEDH